MLHVAQKDYKLEIVLELAGGSMHIRGLAKKTGINPMLAFRKLGELYKENVVDFRKEGKNKIYSLKRTLEAQTYLRLAENYKLVKFLEKYPFLRELIEKIQANKKINFCAVFGSYAQFKAGKNSDIDIYIGSSDRKLKKEIEAICPGVDVKLGKYNKRNLLIREIEKSHVIIKGVEKFYEKSSVA